MADEKQYLRAILRDTRESLTASFAKTSSARVQSVFFSTVCYRQARAIVLYAALGNEVSTDAILSDALATGREVFFPRLDRARNSLSLCPVASRSDLVPGAYGILEPETPAIEIATLPACVIAVPGIAFTTGGERLGRGGGHYDRLLAQVARPSQHTITVGLAYSFQLLERVPQSGPDRQLNFVVTESAIYPAPEDLRRGSGIRAEGGNPG